MRLALIGASFLMLAQLAGCPSSTPVTFASVVSAVQQSCAIKLNVTNQTSVQTLITDNPSLTTAQLVASYICAAANVLPTTTESLKRAISGPVNITIVEPNGKTVILHGTHS